MPRRPEFDRRLLGGLSPAVFLERHWQRRPLLIRGAIDGDLGLPDRPALAALAARDDVESRLVTVTGGQRTTTQGPFDRLPSRKRDWTLLVQGVNLHDANADALMRRFDFVSAMRLDDVMISVAADGGGVGPHVDSYDVFLLQVDGRRRWRWRTARRGARAEAAGNASQGPFVATDEAVLEPGDMLYLPPSCSHDGVAVGPCTTASIGFRAPSWNELSQEFLFAMAERSWPDGRHADPGRSATTAPGAIDEAMLAAIADRIARLAWTPADIETFVGRYFSEPKPNVWFDPPRPLSPALFARRAAARGLRLDLRATLLHRGAHGYIAGESFQLPRTGRRLFRRLADRRRVDAASVAAMLADADGLALLHAWWGHGWIRFAEGDIDAS